MDIIYYHGSCPDGWAAAYIAHLKYPEAELIPLSYGGFVVGDIIEQSRDQDVMMVDFALKTRKENDELYAAARSLLIIDHHKSALAIIGDASYATFDMNRSGAGLTWDYLFGENSTGEWTYDREQREGGVDRGTPRPWWVSYTEDQDLWLFKKPASRQVNAWLNIQPRTIERWNEVADEQKTEPADAARKGYAIQDYIAYSVGHAMHDLQEGVWVIEGRNLRVGVVNNGHIGTSEVGEAIYNAGYDVALMWREDGRGIMRFGLRSNTVDVGSIAASFPGGGGHKASSGFELTVTGGRMLIDRILGRTGHVSTISGR